MLTTVRADTNHFQLTNSMIKSRFKVKLQILIFSTLGTNGLTVSLCCPHRGRNKSRFRQGKNSLFSWHGGKQQYSWQKGFTHWVHSIHSTHTHSTHSIPSHSTHSTHTQYTSHTHTGHTHTHTVYSTHTQYTAHSDWKALKRSNWKTLNIRYRD